MITEENNNIENFPPKADQTLAEKNNELENCRKQGDEYLDGWKRAKADYLNLKKEMEAQNKEIKEWMSKIMILPLLGIMDSFGKAFSEIPENIKNDPWVKGIEGIKKQFEDYMKAQRVESITAKGEKFNPEKHEAVESVEGGPPAQAGESSMVAEELQKGYLINGEVLRPAKVKVYK